MQLTDNNTNNESIRDAGADNYSSSTLMTMSDDLTNPESESLTPAEIDARHARQLLERALAQLERGERDKARLSSKQAILLAPTSSHSHSVAGFLALLNQDANAAVAAYEKSIEYSIEDSVERNRLIELRQSQVNSASPDIALLLPNVDSEILRLRGVIRAAPLATFLRDTPVGATQNVPALLGSEVPEVKPLEFDLPPGWSKENGDRKCKGKFPARLLARKSTPAIATTVVLMTLLLSFLAVRALRGGAKDSVPLTPSSQIAANGETATPNMSSAPADAAASAPSDSIPATQPAAAANDAAPPSSPAAPSTLPVARAVPATPSRPAPRTAMPKTSAPPRIVVPSTPRPQPARRVSSEPSYSAVPPSRPSQPRTPAPIETPKAAVSGDDGDVGPRFSPPSRADKADDTDDVGPRFSNP